jgi:ectoine hydroxylase-related dioxygenase (phytanoyl-CoA dioxygenase family)
MFEKLKRVKMVYELYNLFHYDKLKYQADLYRKIGLNKKYYSSISSKDFPANNLLDNPWLDNVDSAKALPLLQEFMALDQETKSALLNWSKNGFAILKGFYSEQKVSWINEKLERLIEEKRMPIKDKRKYMFAVKYSEELRNSINSKLLEKILELLMGKPLDLFQSVNFLKGSEEPAHSDFIHMSTYPYGYLIAVWIALEDIKEGSGALFYYPGSHKMAYVMNGDYDNGGNRWLLGKNSKQKYIEKIEEKIKENNLEKKVFTASKGDILIWHANLLHGGSEIIDLKRTRKSMVLHYYGRDVIRYHEVTERPSLLESY